MSTNIFCRCYILMSLVIGLISPTNAQVNKDEFNELKRKVERLESENWSLNNRIERETSNIKNEIEGYAPLAIVLFLYGCFCALWAQNTGRNSWSWFFLGLIFSVVAVVGLLIRNSNDMKNNE